jgi:hypothetical protein
MLVAVAVPDWLIGEKYVTLATWGLVLVTFLLVIATAIMYFDSRSKSKEQRERWKQEDDARAREQKSRWEREDQRRAEDSKPKVVVEISRRQDSPEIVFRCFNLGSTIFFVDQLIITATSPRSSVRTTDIVGPPVLLPGTLMSTPYDCEGLITESFQEAKAEFIVRGQHGLERTEPVWFYVSPDPIQGYDWTVGRLADRLPGALVPQPRLIPNGQRKPIPEFVIEIAKEGDDVIGFKIRNVSSENLHDVGISNMQSRVGEIAWYENFFPCLDARIGVQILTPHSYPGQRAYFHNVSTLTKALQESPSGDNPEHVGDIVVWARDATGTAYKFSAALELWNLHTWRVWNTKRELARPSNAQTSGSDE